MNKLLDKLFPEKYANAFYLAFNQYVWPGFGLGIVGVFIDLTINGYNPSDLFFARFDWCLFLGGLLVSLLVLYVANSKKTWFLRKINLLDEQHSDPFSGKIKGQPFLLNSNRVDLRLGHNIGSVIYILIYSITFINSFINSYSLWPLIYLLIFLSFYTDMQNSFIYYLCARDANTERIFIKECLREGTPREI